MLNMLFIAVGGALGALSRYGLTHWIHQNYHPGFPWATLLINFFGSTAIGMVFVLAAEKNWLHSDYRMLFLMTGFLGAFTTYSTFSLDAMRLYESGAFLQSLFYVVGTTTSCIVGVVLGASLIRSFY